MYVESEWMASKKIKKPKIIKLTLEQQTTLVAAVEASNLDQDIGDFLVGLVYGNRWLVEGLEAGILSINKLRRILQITTETAESRKKQANNKIVTTNLQNNTDAAALLNGENVDNLLIDSTNTVSIIEAAKTSAIKGHGRYAADEYTGADIVNIKLDGLKAGGPCPAEYCDGKLYESSDPGVFVQITGGKMATATRYNLEKLRCNICEIVYTATLPDYVGITKYDDNFVALLMIHKYFISVPFFRQETLQQYLGVPLASSTQWDLIAAHKDVLAALYGALVLDAANGKGLCIDDTRARILEQIAKNKKQDNKKEKKSCYTTGIVSIHDDHKVYIYMTDNLTAGKSAAPILKLRDPELPPPYLMCDALTANIPHEISKDLYILCYCLVHARRQFYDLPNGYDDLADKVIFLIGKIYDNEQQTKGMNDEARLKYHQDHSQGIMNELKTYLDEQSHNYEPNGIAGIAIKYVLKRWTELTQFLRFKNVPLDNNITERALKLIIQLRKSSMFYKTLASATIASHIQSALYSAAQNNVNPHEYMELILKHKTAVLANPGEWLPWQYQETLRLLEEGSARQELDILPG